MTNKFLSNNRLEDLLSKATTDERLALTKILDEHQKSPYDHKKLQEEICLFGGHGIANWFRGSGTGYLDIVDDVAEMLKINDRKDYQTEVAYFEEFYYVRGEKDDKPGSKVKRKFSRVEAEELGEQYAEELEKKIIIQLMKNAYEQIQDEREKLEYQLQQLTSDCSECKKQLQDASLATWTLECKINEAKQKVGREFISDKGTSGAKEKYDQLLREKTKHEEKIRKLTKKVNDLPALISAKKRELADAIFRLDNFNKNLEQTIHQYDSSNLGAITGTAGLVALANLGGFATYTFLTSMMSTISFGTLGFGAYTAATSLLSIAIGPVGWAGLGLWAAFSLGKPDRGRLALLVAATGAIRQRLNYESSQNKGSNFT